MKLKYTFLFLFLTILTSCSSPSVSEEEALFEDDAAIGTTMSNALMVEIELFEALNAHREEKGLTKLALSDDTYRYAQEHNDYMISKGKISHDNFNSRASNLANETGATSVKENVAKNYPKAIQALNGWLSSKPHRNTIEGDFTHTIISVTADEKGKLYYTNIFFKR